MMQNRHVTANFLWKLPTDQKQTHLRADAMLRLVVQYKSDKLAFYVDNALTFKGLKSVSSLLIAGRWVTFFVDLASDTKHQEPPSVQE